MRFAININMERLDPDKRMAQVANETTDLAMLADKAGFDTVFCGEHHTIELTVAPNPFVQLAHWSQLLKHARLGTAVVSVPYWHPIRLAGEAGLLDLLSEGRLELGLGRGAYQYEFDRMGAGLRPERARELTVETVPLLKSLWQGQTERHTEPWSFPSATAVPKPVQNPHPPMWVAARHPAMFDFAVKQGCDIMANPLSQPFDEVISLRERLDEAMANNPGARRPRFMVLRNVCVYDEKTDWRTPVEYLREHLGRFQTLFQDATAVKDGFPEPTDLDMFDDQGVHSPEALHRNHLFGTPDAVVDKLRDYEEAGVDYILYGATWGLPHKLAHRSLELFGEQVLPAFRKGAGI